MRCVLTGETENGREAGGPDLFQADQTNAGDRIGTLQLRTKWIRQQSLNNIRIDPKVDEQPPLNYASQNWYPHSLLKPGECLGGQRGIDCAGSLCKSVTCYANGRISDQNASRRPTPRRVDFMAINDSDGRGRGGTDRFQLYALRDQRTSDENRPLIALLLIVPDLFDRPTSQRTDGEQASRDETSHASKH